MVRVIIGAIPSALLMFLLGYIFYASGLQGLGANDLDDVPAASVQQALARNLPETGTYTIPSLATQQQTSMYSRGPVATVHYNLGGFAGMDAGALIGGLVLNVVVALLIGAALIGIDRRVPDFASRARLVVILCIAASAYAHLIEPLFYHHDWTHFIYRFIADAVTLSAGGLVIARWFLPRGVSAPADAPTDV